MEIRTGRDIVICALAATFVALALSPARADTPLASVPIASGYEFPVLVTAPPEDPDRLLVVERRGVIRLILGDVPVDQPYLDISDRVAEPDFEFDERGLLGVAFHPNFVENGELFLHYTDSGSNDSVIARYRVGNNPNRVDPDTEEILMVIEQPFFNHNGGSIAFSPVDGFLYVALGDGGGSPFDPDNRAQNPSLLVGKILRIDVDGAFPFEIPPDNPFVGPGDPRDEIWALGVRNPWRMSFDRQTGDLYFGDVGQFEWEEVNFQPAASPGGENYGWRCMEGFHCTGFDGCTCDAPELTLPVHEFAHSKGYCGVTGGYVYRGCAVPDLRGTYFFADMCSASIFSFRMVGGAVTDLRDRSSELRPPGSRWLVSFGEDALGELYFCTFLEGTVYKIVPAGESGSECNSILCRRGLVDVTGTRLADVLFVNGSRGSGNERELVLGVDQAVEVSMAAPPRKPAGPSHFALYAWTDTPDPDTTRVLPRSLGISCLPMPITDPESPKLRVIWNNTGKSRLGEPKLPSDPAPTVVLTEPAGIGIAVDLFLQGIIEDSGSRNGRGSLTNGMLLRVR